MGDITAHFSAKEFICPHCGKQGTQRAFIERLEKLFEALDASKIIISSGYRCPEHSVAVGGYRNDAHVMGFAADLIAYKKDGKPFNSITVAKVAERLGFGGIGLIDKNYIHVDSRDINNYANHKWYGNESTGQTYNTFQDMTSDDPDPPTKTSNTLEVFYNGKCIFKGGI